jgi:hypothetical protein
MQMFQDKHKQIKVFFRMESQLGHTCGKLALQKSLAFLKKIDKNSVLFSIQYVDRHLKLRARQVQNFNVSFGLMICVTYNDNVGISALKEPVKLSVQTVKVISTGPSPLSSAKVKVVQAGRIAGPTNNVITIPTIQKSSIDTSSIRSQLFDQKNLRILNCT